MQAQRCSQMMFSHVVGIRQKRAVVESAIIKLFGSLTELPLNLTLSWLEQAALPACPVVQPLSWYRGTRLFLDTY